MITRCICGALLLALPGCATSGGGVPSPLLAPGISADSARVLSRGQRWAFWSSVAELDLRAAERRAPDGDHRRFARAIRQLLDGRMADAEPVLTSLSSTATTDSVLRTASHVALSAALEYQGRWAALDSLSRTSDHSTYRTGKERAAIEVWASRMRLAPVPTYTFPSSPVVLPFYAASTGTPIVNVRVNGISKWFWIDTGSSMTLIASDVAAQAGVKPLSPDTLHMVTAVGVANAQAAAIGRLEIGGLVIQGQQAAIISADQLALNRGDAPGESGIVRIDGVIGMDVVRRLDLRIDFLRRQVRFARPRPVTGGADRERNLLWLGYPVVRVEQPGGRPLYFGLDTGADRTYATEALLAKLPRRYLPKQRQTVSGFGGDTTMTVRTIPDLRLSIANRSFTLQEIAVHPPQRLTFLQLDGVIGMDTAAGLTMRIDMTNGLFGIDLSLAGWQTDWVRTEQRVKVTGGANPMP